MLEQRIICLVPIPFTNLHSTKKRPVLIISNTDYNQRTEDILVMAITSNIKMRKYSTLISYKDMETGNLLKQSLVRVDKIYSINKSLVVKEFGKINICKFDEIKQLLEDFLSND